MDKPMPYLEFKVMTFLFKVRDILAPRKNVLLEAGVKEGQSVLDYGCGPGSYIGPLAELVGESGKIYALDIHPLAISGVERIAKSRHLSNIQTILSDCGTGLEDESLDLVLLYDIFHGLSQPEKVLTEIHRVLKPKGVLSFSDHHMRDKEIVSKLTESGLFRPSKRGKKTFSFAKIPKK